MPEAGPGELVLRVEAALTCGTDLKVYRRGYHAKMLTVDRLFGHEVAGVVAQVGEGVTEFAVGERVVPLNSAPCDVCFFCTHGQQNLCDDLLFNNGAYAEYIRVPARIVAKNTLRVPDGDAAGTRRADGAAGVRDARAGGVGREGRAHDDRAGSGADWAAVYPCGVAGGRACDCGGEAHGPGGRRRSNLERSRWCGLAMWRIAVAAARALTPEGRGADIVIEAVATPQAWQWATLMARKGGLVNLFGGPPAGTTVEFDTNLLHYSDLTLKASFHHTPATARRRLSCWRRGGFGVRIS